MCLPPPVSPGHVWGLLGIALTCDFFQRIRRVSEICPAAWGLTLQWQRSNISPLVSEQITSSMTSEGSLCNPPHTHTHARTHTHTRTHHHPASQLSGWVMVSLLYIVWISLFASWRLSKVSSEKGVNVGGLVSFWHISVSVIDPKLVPFFFFFFFFFVFNFFFFFCISNSLVFLFFFITPTIY